MNNHLDFSTFTGTLSDLEHLYVTHVLSNTSNIAQAAKTLGVTRQTLYTKARELLASAEEGTESKKSTIGEKIRAGLVDLSTV